MNNICGEYLPKFGVYCQLPPHDGSVDHKVSVGKSAYIHAESAVANFPKFNRQNVFLMDPDQPKEDPNDLLNRVHGGKMMDPKAMNHNCPFCNKTMAWDIFVAHAEYCFRRWRKVVYRKKRIIGV